VPAARVATIRKAFADTFRDPAFLADSKRMALGVNTPKTGEQIQQLIAQTYNSPPETIDRLRKLSLH
jgi:hypothetical protein